jgi:hypothetical protein
MTSLADHHSTSIVKLLLLGDAKVGKTASLVSLVNAGYKLRILDFDNLLDYFYQLVKERCPDKLANVDYRTLRDPIRAGSAGAVIAGKPAAWINAIKMLDSWKYDDIDLGVPASWDSDTILVIDSLSRLCDAAYDFHESAIPKSAQTGGYDGRAVYGNAQDDVEKVLGMLTARSFNTNVIVICHGLYMDMPDGSKRIFPQGVGQKLSPKIPQYFPNYVRYKMDGQGKRTIQLESDNMIALASARKLPATLPSDTGLADFFAAFREPPAKRSTVLPLQRKAT